MCLALSLFSSCTEMKLRTTVQMTNSECPIPMGPTGEITSVTYTKGAVEYLYTVDEQFVDLDVMSNNCEEIKAMVAPIMLDDLRPLIDMLIETNTNLHFVIRGKSLGKETILEYTPTELEELLEDPEMPSPVQNLIDIYNKKLPMEIRGGVITEIVDKGDAVLYMIKITDKNEFNYLSGREESVVKNAQKELLKMFSNPVEESLLKIIVEYGKGFGYTYFMDGTDETFDIVYTNEELKGILGELKQPSL